MLNFRKRNPRKPDEILAEEVARLIESESNGYS